MLIIVVWFQWCGIKSGFMVLGMCLFFVRTSNDKLNLSDKSATIVANRTSSPLVSSRFSINLVLFEPNTLQKFSDFLRGKRCESELETWHGECLITIC